MKKFIVTIIKTDTYSATLEVDAETIEQAESIAEEDAREKDLKWRYEESEWFSYGHQVNETP